MDNSFYLPIVHICLKMLIFCYLSYHIFSEYLIDSENLKNWIWFINKNRRNFLSRGIKYHLMSDLVNNNCHKSTEEHNQNPSGMWLSRYIIIKLIRPSFYHQMQLLWPLVLLFGREGRTLEIFIHPIGKSEYVSWLKIQNTLLMWCS